MSLKLHSPLGLIAGNGIFPIEFAENASKRGLEVVAIAHRGETDSKLEKLVKSCQWIKVGELGKLLNFFQSHGAKQVAFAGGIRRPKLFGGIKFDARGLQLVSRVGFKDDVLLRAVAGELEALGIEVISASSLLDKSLAQQGLLTRRDLSAQEKTDAIIGWDACKGIGALDIGQTVVVNQGVVVSVEGIDGTDATILRAGKLSGRGATVVKLSKPQQDLRIDLPTIGFRTIKSMKKAGASALILESAKAILLEPELLVPFADRCGISIRVFSSKESISLA